MKKVQTLILIGTLLCMLLVGCQGTTSETPVPYEDTKDKQLEQSQAKVSYYEDLVVTMQQQILDLKSALYTSRAEYDALYALYQASDKESFDASIGNSALAKDFRYVKADGCVTITAYTGSDESIVVPATIEGLPVTAIADRAFSQLDFAQSITVPSGVIEIGWFAFSGCTDLRTVELPDTVTRICYGAFENCNAELVVSAPKNSYAATYAASYGIRTQ